MRVVVLKNPPSNRGIIDSGSFINLNSASTLLFLKFDGYALWIGSDKDYI